MSDPARKAPEEHSFGEALAELDQIVAALESGQLELEESIARYERGVGLVKAAPGQARRGSAEGDDAHRRARGRHRPPMDCRLSGGASEAGGSTANEEVPF